MLGIWVVKGVGAVHRSDVQMNLCARHPWVVDRVMSDAIHGLRYGV